METGRKHFGSNNELTTEPKGETCFRDNGARKEAWRTQKGKQQENNPKSTRWPFTNGTEMKQRVTPPGLANPFQATLCPSDMNQTPLRKEAKSTGKNLGPITAKPPDNVSECQKDSTQKTDHNSQGPPQDQTADVPQDTKCRKESQGPQSSETEPQATHPPLPKTTTRLDTQLSNLTGAASKLDTTIEVDKEENMSELNARLACLRNVSCSGCQFCLWPQEQHPCNVDEMQGSWRTALGPKDHLSGNKKIGLNQTDHSSHETLQDLEGEIQLCTPNGDKVLWEEVKWARNPYSFACHDHSDLLGVTPGHYYLQATPTAVLLCAKM